MSIQQWKWNGTDLVGPAWAVAEVPKGIGVPPKRGGNLKVPYIHGDRYRAKMFEPRVLSLPMWVRGLDKDTGLVPVGKTEKDQLFENMDYLSGLFCTRTQAALRRTWPDGTTVREAQAEILTEVDFHRVDPRMARLVVDFYLADPFFYGLVQTNELTDIDAEPTTWTHTNLGTAPAVKMTITMTGPLAAPKIENLSNGVWLQYNGSIGGGETVVFDTTAFTIVKGSENMISALRHQGAPQWMILERGGNSMRVTCDEAPNGSVRIQYYPAYS
jgi:hypothetical protein